MACYTLALLILSDSAFIGEEPLKYFTKEPAVK